MDVLMATSKPFLQKTLTELGPLIRNHPNPFRGIPAEEPLGPWCAVRRGLLAEFPPCKHLSPHYWAWRDEVAVAHRELALRLRAASPFEWADDTHVNKVFGVGRDFKEYLSPEAVYCGHRFFMEETVGPMPESWWRPLFPYAIEGGYSMDILGYSWQQPKAVSSLSIQVEPPKMKEHHCLWRVLNRLSHEASDEGLAAVTLMRVLPGERTLPL